MKNAIKRQRKGKIIISIVLCLACVFFFVAFGLFVNQSVIESGTSDITAAQIIYNLYAYGGFISIFLILLAICVNLKGRHRSVWNRIFMWAIILLSYHFAATFFANAINFGQMTFQQVLIYAGEYLPALLLAIAFIAVIWQWNLPNKGAVHAVAWVTVLCSSFLSAWFIYYKATSLLSFDAILVYDMLFSIAHAIVMPVATIFAFCMTVSDKAFNDWCADKVSDKVEKVSEGEDSQGENEGDSAEEPTDDVEKEND